jgi:hypothetical protein
MQKEMMRRAAIVQSGYAFIVLVLRAPNYSRVSGIDELIARPTEVQGQYTFQIQSRQIMFTADIQLGGLKSYYMLDTPNNRRFLASHKDMGYWDIQQVISGRNKILDLFTVLKELEELKQEQIKKTIKANKGKKIPKLLPDTKKLNAVALTDEELQAELTRRGIASKILEDLLANKVSEINVSKSPAEEKRSVESATKEVMSGKYDLNMSDEEFNKLSKGQKSVVTRLRREQAKNKTSAGVNVSKRPDDDIVVDEVNPVTVSDSLPESVFLKKGVGVVQP